MGSPKGIRTVMVAPGIFPTPGASARLYPDPAEYEAQVARVPVRRVGQHAEFADLCSYLMSEHAGFINGDCVTMDGALRWPRAAAEQSNICTIGGPNNGRNSARGPQERSPPNPGQPEELPTGVDPRGRATNAWSCWVRKGSLARRYSRRRSIILRSRPWGSSNPRLASKCP